MGTSLSQFNLFLFDMDGTLVEFKLDFQYLKNEATRLLEEKGINFEIKRSLSEAIRDSKYYFVNEEDYIIFVNIMEDLTSKHEIETANKAEAFPHSKELLKYLKSKGKNIGIITRNCRAATIKTLEVSDLIDYIDIIVTREDVVNSKPHPEHVEVAMKLLDKSSAETVVIGDHEYDIASGKSAGCFTIGMLSGVSSEETLKTANIVISSLEDIISFL